MTKDTADGRIISHCPISNEMAVAANECFVAYKLLNEKLEKFNATIPKGYNVKNFYGNGDTVVIDSDESIEESIKYWQENS